MANVDFFVMDVDSEPNTGIRPEFSVRGIPACYIIKDSKVISSKIGSCTEQQFLDWIKSSINT
tara:strand:- start:555 stop:743 length:189 start_codon:yes stop_codon:yes gene_type:complete